MASATKQKLFKLASEINIGKDAIVEFLVSKGYHVENKPTVTLDPDMVEAVYEKFKREKKAAEKQREKVQKQKDIRKIAFEREHGEKEPGVKASVVDSTDAKEPIPELEPQSVESEVELEVEIVENDGLVEIESVPDFEEVEAIEPEVSSEIMIETSAEIEAEPEIEETIVDEQPIVVFETELPEEAQLPDEIIIDEDEPIAEETVEAQPEEDIDIPVKQKSREFKIIGKIELESPKKKKEKIKVVEKKLTPEEEAERLAKLKKKVRLKGSEKIDIEKVKVDDKKKRKKKKSIREQINQVDVDKAIRRTLSGMEDHHGSARSKIRQKRRLEREEKEMKIAEEKEKQAGILELTEFVTTSDLANLMGVGANEVILKCMQLGLMVTINQRLDKDTLILIADDYDYEVRFVEQESISEEEDDDPEELLLHRPPIVTIMGHVDHGKTSLLDFIRHTNVVAGEAGGITQHIAAYKVKMADGKSITFLDTPGHEAFTAMRARGAQVTDIVVLVVAADDSVMPQTIEAISHAQAAKVPIIVAINKIDKPDARPDRIKQQLADHKILVEDWGGKNQSVEISAKFGQNVELLLEKIILEAELLELKANPDRKAKGTIIESHMAKGLGNVSTVIVQKGTLRIGDPFVAGAFSGRVRAMLDERGNKVEEAGPSIPVGVIGFEGLPEAGDILSVVNSDSEARITANQRQQLRREQELRQMRHITLDEISKQIQIGGIKDLKLILKGDVAGSVEALSDSLLKLSRDEVRVDIIHKGVGAITESDVMLAVASHAVIIGFQVAPTVKARRLADSESVDIRQYNIIYDCINEIQLALEGLLSPEVKEEVTSTIEIRRVFRISRLGNIAGCYVQNGKISRNDKVRILRNGFAVFNGNIHSLKRNKDDVREVEQGYECGIQFSGFNDLEEGDIIEGYKITEVKRHFD